MRTLPLLILLVVPAAAFAAERVTPPASAANLVRYRPVAWQLPFSGARAAVRVEPETGEANETATPPARGAMTASLRQSAAANVRTHADGSRHAVLGAAFRSWTVVSIGADGRLVTDCVDDADVAKQRVEATREVPR